MSRLPKVSQLVVLTGAIIVLAIPLVAGIDLDSNGEIHASTGKTELTTRGSAATTTGEIDDEPEPLAEPEPEPIERETPRVPATPIPVADEWAMMPDGDVEFDGPGTLQIAEGTEDAPEPEHRIHTLLIQVEDGLPIDVDLFAAVVMDVLNDARGWGNTADVSFARTDDPDDADLVFSLATPSTTDELCAPVPTNGRWSCGRTTSVTINADNWVHATDAFLDEGGSAAEYRRYVINHEVGHYLGYPHIPCPAPGETAPVMLQQSIDLQGCTPNGWPSP